MSTDPTSDATAKIHTIACFDKLNYPVPISYAQQNLENFDVIGLEDGFSHGTVRCFFTG